MLLSHLLFLKVILGSMRFLEIFLSTLTCDLTVNNTDNFQFLYFRYIQIYKSCHLKDLAYQADKQERERHSLVLGYGVSRSCSSVV